MTKVFAFMIMLVIVGYIFCIWKSTLDVGQKLLMSLIGAGGIVVVGAIYGALVIVYPILALPFIFFVLMVVAFLIWGAIVTREDKPKKADKPKVEKPDPNITAEMILETLTDIQKGQEIQFGPYKWTVLALHDNEALIYTNDAIMETRFHHDRQARGSLWADCTLRSLLNNRLFKKSFTPAEQSLILSKSISNMSITGYGASLKYNAELPTTDRLFPLSCSELRAYVPKDKWSCKLNESVCDYYLRDTSWSDAYYVSCIAEHLGPVIKKGPSCIERGIRIAAWIQIR